MSIRITDNVCAYLASFVRSKGTNPKEIWGEWCVRPDVLITAAVSFPVSRFLLVPLKRIYYVQKKFDNLNKKLSIQKEKTLKPIKKAQMEFYVELTKELYNSNKLDCSRESDKCRRKRVSYMANKLRQ